MSLRRSFITVSVFAFLATGAASAADPIAISTSTNAEMPVHGQESFDWNGFYAGIFGATDLAPAGNAQFGAGINAGVNAQFDFYLLGGEVAVTGLSDSGSGETVHGQILGRAGLVVTEDVLLYAAGGYGIDLGPTASDGMLLGGGAELAITDSMSVRAQYLHSFPTVGGNPRDEFAIGANFHF